MGVASGRQGLLNTCRNKKGFLLITTYMLLSVASAYAFAFFSRSNTYLRASTFAQNRTVAFNMAEAALDKALVEISGNLTYTGTSGFVSLNSGATRGGYEIAVTTPLDNPLVRVVQATGYSPDNSSSSYGYVKRQVTLYTTYDIENYFDFAVFTSGDMKIAGVGTIKVDSYDSSLSPYNPLFPGLNGELGTDSTASGAINLASNVQVFGNATVGPGGDPSQALSLSNNSTLTGMVSVASSTRSYQPQTSTISSGGSLALSGNTVLTLPSGTYRYDSIDITAGASINATGPVTIYVDGDVTMSGHATVTSANLPPHLVMYVGGDDVRISGGNFFGGIFAPDAKIAIAGTGSMYGSVVGKTCDITGNGNLHYDLAMKTSGQGINRMKVLAWNEAGQLLWDTGSPGGANSL